MIRTRDKASSMFSWNQDDASPDNVAYQQGMDVAPPDFQHRQTYLDDSEFEEVSALVDKIGNLTASIQAEKACGQQHNLARVSWHLPNSVSSNGTINVNYHGNEGDYYEFISSTGSLRFYVGDTLVTRSQTNYVIKYVKRQTKVLVSAYR
ncbi:hypothetical protein [Parapedobacter pyrenivorans]|nr:hypothetical protein [Parapedobacter pyrenivorans]